MGAYSELTEHLWKTQESTWQLKEHLTAAHFLCMGMALNTPRSIFKAQLAWSDSRVAQCIPHEGLAEDLELEYHWLKFARDESRTLNKMCETTNAHCRAQQGWKFIALFHIHHIRNLRFILDLATVSKQDRLFTPLGTCDVLLVGNL